MRFHVNIYLMILPSFLLAAVILILPLYQITELSLSDVTRFGKFQGFAGLDNFIAVLTNDQFLAALWRTVIWTLGIVMGSLLISLPVAMILNEDFHGRGLARVIIMLPWSISLTMVAIVWRWALNGESGMLNSGLLGLGLIDENIQWLARASFAFPMQILIGVLATIPFATTIFLGGLSSVPTDLYEAARIEGASRWQIFREITLPLLRPFVNIAIVLNTIYVFNSFPIIWATTQGGPAQGTDILVTYLYKLGFVNSNLGEAAALSILMFGFLLIISLIYVRMAMREQSS